jgi:hypothetical protein
VAARPETLAEVENQVWRELTTATRDRAHAWRTCVLATADGARADARTVILREADRPAKRLRFFTDRRSPKVGQLLRQPHAMVVMWSASLAWQLRCSVLLSLDTAGDAARSAWARIALTPAAGDYLAPLAPGTPLDAAGADIDGGAHFAIVEAEVLSIDWLELQPSGHRRAVFDAEGARWVQP